jgi:hypothetical protein
MQNKLIDVVEEKYKELFCKTDFPRNNPDQILGRPIHINDKNILRDLTTFVRMSESPQDIVNFVARLYNTYYYPPSVVSLVHFNDVNKDVYNASKISSNSHARILSSKNEEEWAFSDDNSLANYIKNNLRYSEYIIFPTVMPYSSGKLKRYFLIDDKYEHYDGQISNNTLKSILRKFDDFKNVTNFDLIQKGAPLEKPKESKFYLKSAFIAPLFQGEEMIGMIMIGTPEIFLYSNKRDYLLGYEGIPYLQLLVKNISFALGDYRNKIDNKRTKR